MEGKNGKVRGFVKKHSHKFIGGAVLIGAYVGGQYIYRKGYVNGANVGVRIGFGRTIEWCDDNLEGLQLTKRVNTWAQENPDKWYGNLLKEKA